MATTGTIVPNKPQAKYMGLRVGIFSFAVLVSTIMAADASAAEPYDLRGIRLGLSISEFRKLKHPDRDGVRVICSTDPEVKNIRLGFGSPQAVDDEITLAVIVCGHFNTGVLGPGWSPLPLNVATVSTGVEYKFVPDQTMQNVPMLYSIEASSNVQDWSKYWEGYTTKYGKPHRLNTDPTQNQRGATFDNVRAVWHVARARLQVAAARFVATRFVTFQLTPFPPRTAACTCPTCS